MADGSRFRLVRCPKCQNLLPELPHLSLYQCGGCGAVLRAKKKVSASDELAEKYDKERNGEVFEKLEGLSGKEDGSSNLGNGNSSRTEKESEMIVATSTDRRKERAFRERSVHFASCSLSRTESNNVSFGDGDQNVKEQNMGTSWEDKHRKLLIVSQDDNWVNKESFNSGRDKGIAEMSAPVKSSAGSLRSRVIRDKSSLDNYGFDTCYNQRTNSTSAYSDQGPSNYRLGSCSSSYGNSTPIKNYNDLHWPNRIEYPEQDRADMFRNSDELKERFSRSFDVVGKSTGRTQIDCKSAPPDPYCGHATYNTSVQPLASDKHAKPPHFKQYGHGKVSYMTGHDIDMQYLYSKHSQKQVPTYEDLFRPRMPRVHRHHLARQYQHQPPYGYVSGKYRNFNQEFIASYPQEAFYHQLRCSCFHCKNKNWCISSQVPPTILSNQKVLDTVEFNLSTASKMWGYNPQAIPFVEYSVDAQRHATWPSDIDSDFDDFYQNHRRRVMAPATGNRRVCRPKVGGAPFIACCNCFELLRLPEKLPTAGKNQQKMQCGACNTIFLFEIENKKLIVSVLAEKKQLLPQPDNESCEISKEVISSCDGFLNASCTNCSDDFDYHPGYDFHSADFRENLPSQDQRLNLSQCEKSQGLTSFFPKEGESPHGFIVPRDVSSAEHPLKDDISPTFRGPHLQECLGYVSSDDTANRYEKGNQSTWTDQEKVRFDKSTSQPNFLEDVAVATDGEASFSDYLNTSSCHDATDVSKGENISRVKKGSQSFLFSLIKKSFMNISKSNQRLENGKSNVFVNGQPIPDPMVKRAEKQAGPIEPGDYWYDFQAGFWGVMGQPCLGIIPPFIKEFNYLMPENCSAGNTGVFVNGRELHQKDMDLLVGRGLPTTRQKFYIIEISGRVLDKDSGEELDRLGKLAPTIEKHKSGFGMKTPRMLVYSV